MGSFPLRPCEEAEGTHLILRSKIRTELRILVVSPLTRRRAKLLDGQGRAPYPCHESAHLTLDRGTGRRLWRTTLLDVALSTGARPRLNIRVARELDEADRVVAVQILGARARREIRAAGRRARWAATADARVQAEVGGAAHALVDLRAVAFGSAAAAVAVPLAIELFDRDRSHCLYSAETSTRYVAMSGWHPCIVLGRWDTCLRGSRSWWIGGSQMASRCCNGLTKDRMAWWLASLGARQRDLQRLPHGHLARGAGCRGASCLWNEVLYLSGCRLGARAWSEWQQQIMITYILWRRCAAF